MEEFDWRGSEDRQIARFVQLSFNCSRVSRPGSPIKFPPLGPSQEVLPTPRISDGNIFAVSEAKNRRNSH